MSLFGFNLIWDFRIIIWTFLLMILGRALNIYPLSGILNQYRGDEYITFKNQIVMWFSGLRGAIAFALSMGIRGEQFGEQLFSSTIVVAIASIFLFGGFTIPLLKVLKVETHEQFILRTKDKVLKANFLSKIDKNYLQKFFVKKDEIELIEHYIDD